MMTCPHCTKQVAFVAEPEGFATRRWSGNVKEEPYLRCPKCTATFPAWAVKEWQEKR